MTKGNDYTVKRIDEDVFELWYEDDCLTTLTKKEAWPVMTGQVHPSTVVPESACENNSDKER